MIELDKKAIKEANQASSKQRTPGKHRTSIRKRQSMLYGQGGHSLVDDDEAPQRPHELCANTAQRLGLRATEEMHEVFKSIDTDGDGMLSREEIAKFLSQKNIRSREQLALCEITEAYRRMLPREDAVLTLKLALYSLFLFCRKQMFIRDRKFYGFAWGKHFQTYLIGSPRRSTFALIASLELCQNSVKLDRAGPVEFAAIVSILAR
jgi:hypothetical protein